MTFFLTGEVAVITRAPEWAQIPLKCESIHNKTFNQTTKTKHTAAVESISLHASKCTYDQKHSNVKM